FFRFPDISESDKSNLSIKSILARKDKFEKFYTLFMAKSYYGFLLAFTTAYLTGYLTNISLTQIMFIFSVIFIAGQIFTEKTVVRFPKEHLEIYVPLFMSVVLFLFFATENPYLFFISAFMHSSLAFIG